MPYLTIGNSPDRPSPPTPKSSDGFGTSRDSRRVRHTPLTLDQYYYPTILDTFVRDNDQVLSKFLEKNEQPSETRAGKKILMVNNLWIWVVDEKTIITATADDSDQENTGSLLKFIWSEARNAFGEATSVYSIMELFLSAATGFFVAKFAEISNKGPIEIFRDSMRDVETRLFREFLSGLDGADKPEGGLPNRGLDNESQGQRTGLSRYHVISSETVLLEALRDIRDELQMLGSIAEDQETVWKKAVASYNKGKKSRSFQFYTPEDAKKDIDVMLLEAVNTENYINNLLNLRQAEFGRLQAQDSAQLSNVILVLTLITIVFLPLSFLSSLFALDVNSFPHEDGSLRYPGWWLFPILFGVSTIVSVPAILFAWNVNAILAKFRSRNDPRPAKPQIGNTVKYKELQVGRTIADGGTTLQQNESNGWRKSLKRRLRNRDNSIIPV
ncbi:hypothetical protein GGR51DRAFT_236951 [Nemania sp. FL0031]|nr:hypothetical protein GGR51DRAFT_236951 [Nemania sp. FL0031]